MRIILGKEKSNNFSWQSVHTPKVILSWSFRFYDATESFWVNQFVNILPFWCTSLFTPLIFDVWIKIWTQAGPFQSFDLVWAKPFLCGFWCVLHVIVMLKERTAHHLNFFVSRIAPQIMVFRFIIPSSLIEAAVPAEEKEPCSMMQPPPCLAMGDSVLLMMCFALCAKLII